MSQYKVRNWPEYNKSLIKRANLSIWISEDAIKKWEAPRDPHFIGAPKQYSDDAILCMMALKVVYHLPYRQLIGFLLSIFTFMKVDLQIPHFTTVASRARRLGHYFKKLSSKIPKDLVFDGSGFKIYGEGEWKVRQHGKQKRRRWKKFHIAICPLSHEIILAEVTELEEMDCEVMPKLLKKAPSSVRRVIGDGAFDTSNCYKAAYERGISLLVPPRKGSVHDLDARPWMSARNASISEWIGLGGDEDARKIWKKLRGYHRRSLVETAFSRFKRIFIGELFSKRSDTQEVELMLKASVLNKMSQIGMPKGVMI